MKHLKLFVTLSIISLLAVWSMATIEVQTTTPRVDPNGTAEIVGTFRMVFSAPEFGNPASSDTTFYTLVRIQMSLGVQLVKVGAKTKTQITPANFVPVAWEVDFGAPFVTKDYSAVRIVRFDTTYLDLLFTKNMFSNNGWNLSTVNRLRCTIGTPKCVTPTVAPAFHSFEFLPNVGDYWQDCNGDLVPESALQQDTRLCCNFAVTTADFVYDDFWRVGMTAYYSDAAANLGATYSVNFQPADPSLAQKGTPGQTCTIEYDWPCKGDDCNFDDYCNEPATAQVCPTPPPPDQGPTPDCGDGWINEDAAVYFGPGHWFNITENCPAGLYAFVPGGTLTITLQNPSPACTDMNPVFDAGNPPSAYLFDPAAMAPYAMTGVVSGAGKIVTFTLPNEMVWTTFDDTYAEYCILVDLNRILFGSCCLLDVPEDEYITLSVKAEYTPYGYACGYKPGPITFAVAYIYGCEEIPAEPVPYYLYLYFPFLAPVNNTEVNWWCGVALTNYAAQATEGGIFYMWEEDGDEYYIELPALGGHEMWLRNLTDLTPDVQRAVGNTDPTWADEAMSGIMIMTVIDVDYPPNYQAMYIDDGALAGIDAFVLMGDYEQAYGYAARHVDGAQFWYDAPGRAPWWAKKGTK